MKRKSKLNGQVLVDIKELPKRDTKVSFAESISNLQLKLISKDLNKETKNSENLESKNEDNSSLKNKGYSNSFNLNGSNNGQNINNNNFGKQENIEDKDKYLKNFKKRRSMRMNLGKNFEENFPIKKINRGELETINEIIAGDNNGLNIGNKYKKKISSKDGEEKPKKKINIIEELRDFDRKQQIQMEKYIEKKRKKQNELMYKNSKLYKIIKEDSNKDINKDDNKNKENSNTGVINEENEKIKNEKKNSITEEKIKNENLKNNNNRLNDNDNNKNIGEINNININKDDFHKIKEKYFSKFLFSTKFPETEYRTKYFDKYVQNESLSKNLFSNYIGKKEENNKSNYNNINIINNNNQNNRSNNKNQNNSLNSNNPNYISNNNNQNISINNTQSNIVINNNLNNISNNNNKSNINNNNQNNIFNNNDQNNIYRSQLNQNQTNTNNSKPKIITNTLVSSKNKISNETDTTNTVFDSNNKYNYIEQSSNTNTYIMTTHRFFNKNRTDRGTDTEFQMIINSIDDKLYNKKNKNKIIFPYNSQERVYSYSSGKMKTSTNNKLYKNSFRDALFSKYKNNSYKDICERYHRYNGLKLISNLPRNTTNYNFNNNYKFMTIIRELNRGNKYYK